MDRLLKWFTEYPKHPLLKKEKIANNKVTAGSKQKHGEVVKASFTLLSGAPPEHVHFGVYELQTLPASGTGPTTQQGQFHPVLPHCVAMG